VSGEKEIAKVGNGCGGREKGEGGREEKRERERERERERTVRT